jgi:hypothetical protein
MYPEHIDRSDEEVKPNESAVPQDGWGPPMSNLYVSGLPQQKDVRSFVKQKLRELFSSFGGKVVGLNWGFRKGTCFVGMDSPVSASMVIAKVRCCDVVCV